MSVAASRSSIIDGYYDSLREVRGAMRVYTPFTFLAYSNNVVPAPEEDLIDIVYKVTYVVFFRFLIQLGAELICPLISILPFLPFFLDIGWLSYHWITNTPFEQVEPEQGSGSTWKKAGTVGLLILGACLMYAVPTQLSEGLL